MAKRRPADRTPDDAGLLLLEGALGALERGESPVALRTAESLLGKRDLGEGEAVALLREAVAAARAKPAPAPAGQQGRFDEGKHPRGAAGAAGGGRFIRKGETSPRVAAMQGRLNELGHPTVPDGQYGPETEASVKGFQKKYGLPQTGHVDAATLEMMRAPPPLTHAQVQAQSAAVATAGSDLSRGSKGPAVENVQASLASIGYSVTDDAGVYGKGTEAAIREIQRKNGFAATGVADKQTVGLLARLAQVSAVADKGTLTGDTAGTWGSPGRGTPRLRPKPTSKPRLHASEEETMADLERELREYSTSGNPSVAGSPSSMTPIAWGGATPFLADAAAAAGGASEPPGLRDAEEGTFGACRSCVFWTADLTCQRYAWRTEADELCDDWRTATPGKTADSPVEEALEEGVTGFLHKAYDEAKHPRGRGGEFADVAGKGDDEPKRPRSRRRELEREMERHAADSAVRAARAGGRPSPDLGQEDFEARREGERDAHAAMPRQAKPVGEPVGGPWRKTAFATALAKGDRYRLGRHGEEHVVEEVHPGKIVARPAGGGATVELDKGSVVHLPGGRGESEVAAIKARAERRGRRVAEAELEEFALPLVGSQSHVKFNPGLHPRDRLGQFRGVLRQLEQSGHGSTVELPHGIVVRRDTLGLAVTGGGVKTARLDTVHGAAGEALHRHVSAEVAGGGVADVREEQRMLVADLGKAAEGAAAHRGGHGDMSDVDHLVKRRAEVQADMNRRAAAEDEDVARARHERAVAGKANSEASKHLYERNRPKSRLREALGRLEEGAAAVAAGGRGLSHAGTHAFDPSEHLRGRGGKFVDMLRASEPGGIHRLPSGVAVEAKTFRFHVRDSAGKEILATRHADEAARAALEADAKGGKANPAAGKNPVRKGSFSSGDLRRIVQEVMEEQYVESEWEEMRQLRSPAASAYDKLRKGNQSLTAEEWDYVHGIYKDHYMPGEWRDMRKGGPDENPEELGMLRKLKALSKGSPTGGLDEEHVRAIGPGKLWEAIADLQEVSSKVYPSLERVPGKQNWVDKTGGLPSYIERIAKHLHYEKGKDVGTAIAIAVGTCRRWCAGGGPTTHGGSVAHVSPETKAKACKAVAEWEAKKGASKAATAAKKVAEGEWPATFADALALWEADVWPFPPSLNYCAKLLAEVEAAHDDWDAFGDGWSPALLEAEFVDEAAFDLREGLLDSLRVARREAALKWSSKRHPRGRGGKFVDVLDKLSHSATPRKPRGKRNEGGFEGVGDFEGNAVERYDAHQAAKGSAGTYNRWDTELAVSRAFEDRPGAAMFRHKEKGFWLEALSPGGLEHLSGQPEYERVQPPGGKENPPAAISSEAESGIEIPDWVHDMEGIPRPRGKATPPVEGPGEVLTVDQAIGETLQKFEGLEHWHLEGPTTALNGKKAWHVHVELKDGTKHTLRVWEDGTVEDASVPGFTNPAPAAVLSAKAAPPAEEPSVGDLVGTGQEEKPFHMPDGTYFYGKDGHLYRKVQNTKMMGKKGPLAAVEIENVTNGTSKVAPAFALQTYYEMLGGKAAVAAKPPAPSPSAVFDQLAASIPKPAGGGVTSFSGLNVVVTGAVKGHTRKQVEALLNAAGATMHSSVGAHTDVLLTGGPLGSNPASWTTKLKKAHASGVKVVAYDDVAHLLEAEVGPNRVRLIEVRAQLEEAADAGEVVRLRAREQVLLRRVVEEATLTAASRRALPDSVFALPGRRYPIHDLAHARNALQRVAQNGTPAEQASVQAAVRAKYPTLGVHAGHTV